MRSPTTMTLSELSRVLDAIELTGCRYWLEGGWGIDALAGHQTRPHGDVDLDVDASMEVEVLAALEALGYVEVTDQRPTRIELVAPDGSCVDVHPLHLDASGQGRQLAPDGSAWVFRAEWFTTGRLGARRVPCFTVEGQRYFHSGYELREVDRADLASLGIASDDPDAQGEP